MGRKKVSRNLAELPIASTLSARGHRTDQLLAILREVALKNQVEQAKPFFSMREVAKHFHAPPSTVAKVYRSLEREGILTLVRSSKTLLQGSQYDRRLSVRAFVGLPAFLSAFITIQDYRMFFTRIRRELRLRGFATAMLLFKSNAGEVRSLGDRLKSYEVDTVIWFEPPPAARDIILRLKDNGVRVVCVSEKHLKVFPSRYEVCRENAIRALLVEWKTHYGVQRIKVIESKDYPVHAIESLVRSTTAEQGLACKVISFKGRRSETFLRDLRKEKCDGIIFCSSALSSMFSFRRPSTVTDLLDAHRVAFLGGPVNMPFARVPEARVDLVTVDWQLVAETIVNDLITQEAFHAGRSTVFEAKPYLRVPLNQFAESI